MLQIKDNKIIQYSLPKTGKLLDGSTVINYHLLPPSTLKEEGWLPLEDIQPEYNQETHYLSHSGYDIQEDKVIKLYDILEIEHIDIDDESTSSDKSLQDRITELEETLSLLLNNLIEDEE